jgi:hypothetical protein
MNARDMIGPPRKSTRGLEARRRQLQEAEQDAAPVAEAGRHGIQGSVGASSQLARARRALKRQQQYLAGDYPSGR